MRKVFEMIKFILIILSHVVNGWKHISLDWNMFIQWNTLIDGISLTRSIHCYLLKCVS